jgi:hypothetical protein
VGSDRLPRALLLVTVLAAIVLLLTSAPAGAATGSPWWHLSTRMFPSNLPPEGQATVVLTAINLGDGQVEGVPTLTATVPTGYSVQDVELYEFAAEQGKVNIADIPEKGFGELPEGGGPPFCEHTSTTARCRVTLATLARMNINRGEALINPYEDLEMRVTVANEDASAPGAVMKAEASGGEAPTARTSQELPVTGSPPAFGLEHFSLLTEEEGGGVDVQAGSHPFQLTTTLTVNEGPDQTKPLALARELAVKLPPGLVGNPSTVPRCTEADFLAQGEEGVGTGIAETVNKCPADTQVGVASLTFDEPNLGGVVTAPVPIFNLVPERGEPARFGFEVVQAPVILDTSIRTGSDYGVTVTTRNITELAAFISSTVTFWGVPGDERHDSSRGWPCFVTGKWYAVGVNPPCVPARQSQPAPLLSLPTSCGGALPTSIEGTSWPTASAPGGLPLPRAESLLTDEFGRELGVSGCGSLRFEPSIDVVPEVARPSSPTGLKVDVHMPEEADETPNGTANATIKELSVTLPERVVVNPASAGGLEACSEAAVGYLEGQSTPPASLAFTPALPTGWDAGVAGFCPSASKIGTVSIVSRLLPPGQKITGSVFLAAQNANPFGSLLAMYIVAEDPVSGVAVKLAGEVSPDPATGRLTTRFRNMPQVPFEDAEVRFFGGPRAALATPATCGTYTTVAVATPWSENGEAKPSSSFQVGPPCPAQRPFAPRLSVTPQSIQAGAFTNLTTTIALPAGSQAPQSVVLQMPPGFSAVLSGVQQCPEEQANAGTCAAASLIGHASASAGVGSEPFEVGGGQVFLTQGYGGAPFGLSIVTPAKAGPFDLGTVVTRARLQIDPHTAQVTVVTDAAAPHWIPALLEGIPLTIRQVEVTLDRPGFAFNPTDCAPMQATGSLSSHEGALAPLSAPFQVANCATLGFKPSFKVSVTGRNGRVNGAGLHVVLSYPKGSFGSEANIARAKVELPRQLPSRLPTLQHACVAARFDADPGSCPASSIVGHAKVTTPVLPVALEGPAYFVSHGGERFPDLTIVLHGYGVTIELLGTTFISKQGITSTTFKATPDVPFESFELNLPQQQFSALAANADLCKVKTLLMPTEFDAQNGAHLSQRTRIQVAGCSKPKKPKKHARRRKHPARHH